MIKVLRRADIYAPKHMGQNDILIADGKIVAIAPEIKGFDGLNGVEVIDLGGAKAAPGYIDLHVHVTGGGGEQGFSSRVPEAKLTELTMAGVTTVVGLLGTDGISRSLENLYAKVNALCEEGITAYMLTGSYSYPTHTLTGSVSRDIALIDKAVGVKVAISDHRSSALTDDEFLRLASEARLGGLLSNKAGLMTMHMGDGKSRLSKVYYALDYADIPIETFLPTHVERNAELTMDAATFTKIGGNVDFTAGDRPEKGGTASSIMRALDAGADIAHITMSSDASGSQPKFDENGRCIGLSYGTSRVLNEEIKRLVNVNDVSLEQALCLVTENPARVLKKNGIKGAIAVGGDADIIVYDDDLSIKHVFAMGKAAVLDKKPILFGKFER